MITKYLNSISINNKYDYINNKVITQYTFCGDGNGDFECRDNFATEDVIRSYIEYCNAQIKIAKKYLNNTKQI